MIPGQGPLVDGVALRVEERHLVAVAEDLGVAGSSFAGRVGLELESEMAIRGGPEAARSATQKRAPDLDVGVADQVIGEFEPSADALYLWCGEGVVDRYGERSRGRRRSAPGGGQGKGRGANRHANGCCGECQQPPSGDAPQELHSRKATPTL